MIPSIEPSEVGLTGLLWLLMSYGYLLYFASNLIAQGSDLLLLVPSMAGLVGGVVLPLLGAVPDGAIMLFSGLGDIDTAQETLSVGVGALAGSTIMLLTVPWALSVYGGRVDLDSDGVPNYLGKPKVTPKSSLKKELHGTGVSITKEVKHGGVVMVLSSIPYFIIQGPAFFLHGPSDVVADGEHWWSLAGLIVCLIGFVSYIWLQLQASRKGMDSLKRTNVMKKLLSQGTVSLSGALSATLEAVESKLSSRFGDGYQSVGTSSDEGPSQPVYDYLSLVLRDSFMRFDNDRTGSLDKTEVQMFFNEFHENVDDETFDELFKTMDLDGDGTVSFHEFIKACYMLIKTKSQASTQEVPVVSDADTTEDGDEQEEQEEVPEDISHLSPDEQQSIIKKRAYSMLFIGTSLVVMFSDPMVDVLQETANRLGMSPFYVSFILAPLASNASEVLASQYYAAKKTRKTISVSLTALEGAASMNNTFCLSIFMGLIFWRGLAWQYTAETITILLVEFIVGFLVQDAKMTTARAACVFALFPASIVFVATLEALGFD